MKSQLVKALDSAISPRKFPRDQFANTTFQKSAKKTSPKLLTVPRQPFLSRGSFVKDDAQIGIIHGDALANLRTLPSDSFNVAVTSPPYYWARDYGYDGQIGHEDSVEEYISALMAVFDEVRRVLHPEGVFYLNIGDTYYSGNGQPHGSDPKCSSRLFMRKKLRAVDKSGWNLPKKSLIGVPWKVAIAMQTRGWTLRSDIIWNRGNAFVEPTARDRPYRQHEHIFLFSKGRFYSFDRNALPEEDVWNIPIDRSERGDHNAMFPAELVRRCIVTGSPRGGKVLDPFVGSGTTLQVAAKLSRTAVGIDGSRTYVDGITRSFRELGYHDLAWDRLDGGLKRESPEWLSWVGNLKNFRKPRSPKKDRSKDEVLQH